MGLRPPEFPALKGFRIVAPSGNSVEGDFPSGFGLAVRREIFDAWLIERAREAGVAIHEGETAPPDLRARYRVVAEGLHSRLGDPKADRPTRIGLTMRVRGLDVVDRTEIRFHEDGEAYLTPGADDTHLAILGRAKRLRGLSGEEAIARILPGSSVRITTPVLGMGPLGRRVRFLTPNDTVLVGDAAGAPDPITGEGMSLALRSALVLSEAIARGDLAPYVAWRLREGATARTFGRRLLAISPLANRVIRNLARKPRAMEQIMKVAVGQADPKSITLGAWLGLVFPRGWAAG
jgi:flavin-dependent dehydrogenase